MKLVQGTLLFPTIVPSNTACTPGGYGWLNYVNYETGSSVEPGGVAGLQFDATIVGLNIIVVQGEVHVGVVTSDNPTPQSTEADINPPTSGFTRTRVIWRELIP
jgi:type IV pilus assembly protein PilY1